jgi:hypothetical protein
MDLHVNTMTPSPPSAPQVIPLDRSWSERVHGWLRMLMAEILCFTSGFRAK